MTQAPEISPGTVSKILWHFTGGPKWDSAANRQQSRPKPAATAYDNLKSIVREKSLRLGNYKEIVRVVLASRRVYNVQKHEVEIQKNVPVTLQSSPVCCIADIPAPHLRYHAYRYGRFAIGFHRDAIIRAGFNPVFYTLENTPIIGSIYKGLSLIQDPDTWALRDAISEIEAANNDSSRSEAVADGTSRLELELDIFESALSDAERSLGRFVAFVKTFSKEEFSSIYCEREWRSTRQFNFTFDDIAMIALPAKIGEKSYYKSFVERFAPRTGVPRRVPIVPWDDLIEH
jgi:hypothetical protein